MDLLVGIESHRKELEAGWADIKWLLLECNKAAGMQQGKQLYAPAVSLCNFQGWEVSKLWK